MVHKLPKKILERVEIDHTPLDLILLEDELLIPIGRPYLTLLVDVFSGCILGFHLSYKCPSYVSAAKAISHAIKAKNLEHLSIKLQNDWPCHGKI
jgi:putative transposase